jgi:large subunit ribosomal protein L28
MFFFIINRFKGNKSDTKLALLLYSTSDIGHLRKGVLNNYKKIVGIPSDLPTFAIQKFSYMARVCQLTGKVPVTGNKVSHSNIKTKRRFLPNLQKKRFYLAEEDKWVTIKLSTEGIRTINKRGLYNVVKELRAKGVEI